MNTGQKLGLVLLDVVMAGNVMVLLSIFVQVLFGDAIERHGRRQSTERNGGAAYALKRFDGKRAWANRELAEIIQPAQDTNSSGKLAGAAPTLKQAIALVLMTIGFGLASTVAAQQRTSCEVSAATLKQQLLDLEAKETRLRMRLEELDEQLKPESIERELAGIGSVHPEELREHRRKLLTIERNGLKTQLDLVEGDRVRIEAAIAAAETAESLEYAPPSASPLVVAAPAKPITEMISLRDLRIADSPLQKLSVSVAMLVLLGGGFILFLFGATQKVEQRIVFVKRGSSGQTNHNCSSDPLTATEARLLKRTRGVHS